MSALGYGLSFLGPIGKGIGMTLQIPDILSDTDDFVKEQSGSNTASLASDALRNVEIVKEVWPKPIMINGHGPFQVAKYPKIIKRVLPFGLIDALHDGIYSITGKEVYDVFNGSKKTTTSKNQRKSKKK